MSHPVPYWAIKKCWKLHENSAVGSWDIWVTSAKKGLKTTFYGKTVLKSKLVEKQNKEKHLTIKLKCFKNCDI